ncbi:MAG: P-II family nitrogen regulator [Rhodocyclaceae bacterium]|jgi:nitrogen regulatory protein P-II 1|nr:P-II family nitrogen regulator [Rhodocyclaceae bacterium]
MKEIKAYIRQYRIADVLQALRDSGLCELGLGARCHNITVAQVLRPLASADPSQQHYSTDLAEAVVTEYKLELVCSDDTVDALSEIIARVARTGQPEAGWVFVSDIQSATEIS